MNANEIIDILETMYPDAHCELIYHNSFELAIAVMLSAQTTDNAVNRVTPALFARFDSVEAFANASVDEIARYIKSIGLYRNKANNIQKLAQKLLLEYDGKIPDNMEDLTSLPGLGRKSANVILSECFQVPSIAVDTHVERIAKRLRLAYKNDSVLTVERKLQKKIDRSRWIKAHHLMIFFGRYKCKAINPDCTDCPFQGFCRKDVLKNK